MALLRFEIWRDEADGEQALLEVSAQNDRIRIATMPKSVLVHSYDASSDFEAFRLNNQWNGWGDWTPAADWTERTFTEAEMQAQRAYLRERDLPS